MNYGIVQHAAVRLWLVCNADVYLPEPKCLTGAWLAWCSGLWRRLGDVACLVFHAQMLQGWQDAAGCACFSSIHHSLRGQRADCHCCPPLASTHSNPHVLAVVDATTREIIPQVDPLNPDPLNTVNTSVLETPNARSEGERHGRAVQVLRCCPAEWDICC
jgi:hypothetical protein